MAIDANADILFAPTEMSAANLRSEEVGGSIMVTGNTGIDALMNILASGPSPASHDGGAPRLLVTGHRRETWGERMRSVAFAVAQLAREGCARIDVLLHPNPRVAGAMEQLLGGMDGIELLLPCTHREFVARMRDYDLILSDSGGIQE